MPKRKRRPIDRDFVKRVKIESPKRTKTIVVRVTQDQYDALKEDADKLGVTLSAYIRTAVTQVCLG